MTYFEMHFVNGVNEEKLINMELGLQISVGSEAQKYANKKQKEVKINKQTLNPTKNKFSMR